MIIAFGWECRTNDPKDMRREESLIETKYPMNMQFKAITDLFNRLK